MINKKKIIVILPAYNAEKTLGRAIRSILNQTYQSIQLIISDDCSDDESVEIIEKWIEENALDVTFIKNDKNLGICRNYNRALKFANGKYLQGAPQDDLFKPEKIEKQIAIFESLDESYAVVYSDASIIDSNNKLINELKYQLPF